MKIYIASCVASLLVGLAFFGFQHLIFPGSNDPNPTSNVVALTDPASSSKQTIGPAVVVAIAPGEVITQEVKRILESPSLPKVVQFTAIGAVDQFVSAFDRSKPSGILIHFDESETAQVLACLPIADFELTKELLETLGTLSKSGKTLKLYQGDVSLKLKQVDNYLFVSHDRAYFSKIPADPESILRSALSQNSVALNIDFQQVPSSIKLDLWNFLKENASAQNNRASYELLKHNMKTCKQYIIDSERLTLNLKVDKDSRTIAMNSMMLFKPESTLAIQAVNDAEAKPTKFSGFRNDLDAGLSLSVCSETMSDYLKAQLDQANRLVQSDPSLQFLSKPEFREFLTALGEATTNERFDSAINCIIRDEQINILGGVHVADLDRLESAFTNVLDLIDENDGFNLIKFRKNVATHQGVVFHEFKFEPALPGLTLLLGNKNTFLLGFGNEALYFGTGDYGLDALKKCLDSSIKQSEERFVSHATVRLSHWLNLFDGTVESDFQENVAKWLKGHDELTLATSAIENGYQTDLKLNAELITSAIGISAEIGRYSEAEFRRISSAIDVP